MTHCERILDVLADGKWHSTSNIHRRAGNMIIHSRIADLRKKGHLQLPPAVETQRTPAERFRLYGRGQGRDLRLLATCGTREAIGVALATLAEEGEFEGLAFGLLDTHGTDETPGTWLVNPWAP